MAWGSARYLHLSTNVPSVIIMLGKEFSKLNGLGSARYLHLSTNVASVIIMLGKEFSKLNGLGECSISSCQYECSLGHNNAGKGIQ